MTALLDETEAPALCFRSAQDAIDYAHHVAEDSNRRLAALCLDAVERYVKGDVCLVITANFVRHSCQCDLVFIGVPVGIFDTHSADKSPRVDDVGNIDHAVVPKNRGELRNQQRANVRPADIEGNERAVFLGVTELIQGPEGVIPSFVWVEAPKQRQDFRWQILAAATANYRLDSSRVVPEGKLTSFRIEFSSGHRASVTTLVQDCAQIVSGIKNNVGQLDWQPPLKDDLMHLMSGIVGIGLDPVGPRLITYELIDFGIEIVDVMLCALDGAARTLKEIAHGWQRPRPDERP